jgi:MFS family permease
MATSGTSQLGGVQAWVNWLLGAAFVVFVFTFQTGYAITNIDMTQDLALTVAQVGFIASIYTWAFALAQFCSGSILDRLGFRWVLPIASAVVTLGGYVFSNATGPAMLVLGQVLMALGASFGFVGAGFVGGRWFGPIKYGLMFAWVQFVASISAIVGQKIIGGLAATSSWSGILNNLTLMGLVVTIAMFILMREPVTGESKKEPWPGIKIFIDDLLNAIAQVAAIRDSWINALIGGATFGCMLALGVLWGPRFLAAGGMEQSDAFGVSAVMWAGLAFGAPVFAWLSDLVKKRKIPMLMGAFFQFLAIIYIMLNPSMSNIEASIAFFVWGFMAGGSMLNFPIGADLVKPALIGTSAAIVNAVQFIVGGLILALPGRVLSGSGLIARVAKIEGSVTPSVNDYQWAISILPISLFIALILFCFLKETYPTESK